MLIIFNLTNFYSSNCGLKCFLKAEGKATYITPSVLVTSKTVGNIRRRVEDLRTTTLHDINDTDTKVLGDAELLEIHQFRRIHIRSSTVASGAPVTPRAGHGIVTTEPYDPKLHQDRIIANPSRGPFDGELYAENTIFWLIRKVCIPPPSYLYAGFKVVFPSSSSAKPNANKCRGKK
jgi:hypothetical protein